LNFFQHKIGEFLEIFSPSVNSTKFSFLVKFCQRFNITKLRGEKNFGHNKFPITNIFGYWMHLSRNGNLNMETLAWGIIYIGPFLTHSNVIKEIVILIDNSKHEMKASRFLDGMFFQYVVIHNCEFLKILHDIF
jgi:hypothetical protein